MPRQAFKVSGIHFDQRQTAKQLDDALLDNLRDIPSLQELVLYSPEFTDTGIERLSTFPGLTGLRNLLITDAPITDASLAHIQRFQQLTGLTLGNPMGTDKTRITDAGLAHLAELTHLTGLHIYQNQGVTDATGGQT